MFPVLSIEKNEKQLYDEFPDVSEKLQLKQQGFYTWNIEN